MADEHKTDIVMRFVSEKGDVLAECALDKSPTDIEYMEGFTPQTYNTFSNFFEVKKFDFGFNVQDEDTSSSTASGANVTVKQGVQGLVKPVAGEFASWRSATEAEAEKIQFKLESKPFSFERVIDAASPIFFYHCTQRISFRKAILVKRTARNLYTAAQGFLRIEFDYPLITGLSWDDGDLTTEKTEFVCRKFTLKYRQQRANGSWLASASASWDAKDDGLPKKAKG